MEKELFDLILDYSSKNKLIDKVFVIKLIQLFNSRYDIKEHLKGFNLTSAPSEDGSFGNYNSDKKEITIHYKDILKCEDYYYGLLSANELFLHKNLILLLNILHELMHVDHFKKVYENTDRSIETKILQACIPYAFSFGYDREKEFNSISEKVSYLNRVASEYKRGFVISDNYKKNYRIDPRERMAEVTACRMMLDIIKPLKSECPNIYEYHLANLYTAIIKGYNQVKNTDMCPTELFLSRINATDTWKQLDFYDPDKEVLQDKMFGKYNLIKRARLGLYLTKGERLDTLNRLKETKKYQLTRKNNS